MIVINPTDLRANQKKYFDLAMQEQVFVKRGRQLIELVVHQSDISEEDIKNGISGDQLIKEVSRNIKQYIDNIID